MVGMDYSKAEEWKITEASFDPEHLGKCESIMCQGNGYLGLRNATDEFNAGEQRNLFVAGTFNKFDQEEVTELPNAADVTRLDLQLDGERFNLQRGEILEYSRDLCLKNGEVLRNVLWKSRSGGVYRLEFRRIVSLERRHVIAQQLRVTPQSGEAKFRLCGGIDGRMNNSGSQHFSEGEKRLYEGCFMQYSQTTSQSKIDFFLNTAFRFTLDGVTQEEKGFLVMDRRRIQQEFELTIPQGQTLVVEKISTVHTSRDKESAGLDFAQMQAYSLEEEKCAWRLGYEALLAESAKAWEERVWDNVPVTIRGKDPFDQLAIRFAQYHLQIMTPAHDHRMNVAAKGLSGEAYKGHTFWDTEMFILPYFIYTMPGVARSLEEYRWLGLAGAHKKAAEKGYEGAQFPWEAAWIDDGEVTPPWGAADIVTGTPIQIWSGVIEQHISADVAYGAWQYATVSGDQEFMDRYGYELIFDTAKFWASRLEPGEDGRLHLNNVIGPDEYKEHVDNNAFTNYMAAWNIRKALDDAALLREKNPALYRALSEKLDLPRAEAQWAEKLPLLYLPKPREDGVIPQDKTYLTLKDIDLRAYKKQEKVGSIFRDYNQEQISLMQVSKQADILLLFLLREDLFSREVKEANWNYYEPRTLHDSSLSLSTHCILANDMGKRELAYQLFQQAAAIDAGPNMDSSSAGIHAAAIAGIWQSVVFGFGGLRMLEGKLRIDPKLPETWEELSFYLHWKGQKVFVTVTKDRLTLVNQTGTAPVDLTVQGVAYRLADQLDIKLL